MKIRDLTLVNYRAFHAERTFPFGDQFTAIAGINGRGKTAILDGLALLLSWFLKDLGVSKDAPRTMSKSELHGKAKNSTLSMNLNCAKIPLTYGVDYSSRSRSGLKTKHLSPTLRRQVVSAYDDPKREDDQAPLAVYYTTDRAGYRVPRAIPRILPGMRWQANTGALRDRMVDYKELIARYRVWKRERRSNTVEAFDTALQTFLEEFGAVEVATKPPWLRIQKKTNRLDPTQLSDGERSFLAIVGDLIRRLSLAHPALKNPLLGAGVVLIDELELHLHPKWQREVVDKLRKTFPNIQFITTTHSPFIIQSLQPGELINLDPDEFGEYADKSVEDIAENVMGVDLPQKSERYLQLMTAAEDYFRLLRSRDAVKADIDAAERRLNELSVPFSDDPAFQALLKLEREIQQNRR